MENRSIWTEETSVKTYQTDASKKWKPACFFEAMQEAATHHASSIGFDFGTMLSNDTIWLLSRVKIRFYEFPAMQEKVIVETWPKGIQQKIFFMRDFKLSAPDGRRFAEATSAWLLIQPSTRRMLMPQALPGRVPDNDGLSVMDEMLEKINPGEDLPEKHSTRAGYSTVDLMGHVNNARYIDWICDCFPVADFVSKRLEWLQINYLNEVRPEECVTVSAAPNSGDSPAWVVLGTNQTRPAKAFEAALRWAE